MLRSIVLSAGLAGILLSQAAAQAAQEAAQPKTGEKAGQKPGQQTAKPAPAEPPPVTETIIPMMDLPTAYRVVATNSMYGTPQTVTTYRSGGKVLIDEVSTAKGAQHIRTLYNLAAHTTLSWTWPNTTAGCSAGTFTGDWGDPFANQSAFNGPDSKLVAEEPVHGAVAYVMEGPAADGTARAWIDPRSGLLLKAALTPKGGTTRVVLEVTDVDLNPPPDSVFVVPPICAAAAASSATPGEQMARLTGDNADDFTAANVPWNPPAPPPDAANPDAGKTAAQPTELAECTVLFRVVRAGSMMPVTSGFQTAIDLTVDQNHPPDYTIGITPEGLVSFAGGGLHEVTSDFRDGVLRIENAPKQFEIDTEFGTAGSGHALIFRQCFAPETTLLFVVRNPGRLSDGGQWLWVKAAKPAPAHPAPRRTPEIRSASQPAAKSTKAQ